MRIVAGFLFFVFALTFFVTDSRAGDKDIKAEIVKTRMLVEGRRNPAVLHLEHKGSGFPVMIDELDVDYGEPIRLLMIDPMLNDYHQEFPLPMERPGDYIFTMTPHTPCTYKVWADVDTVSSGEQYVTTNIPGSEDCHHGKIRRTYTMEDKVSGYIFQLSFDDGKSLAVGKDTTVKLAVRKQNGVYFSELEPIKGAFAHVVGFYDDYKTVTILHPTDEAPTSYTDRGACRLSQAFCRVHD